MYNLSNLNNKIPLICDKWFWMLAINAVGILCAQKLAITRGTLKNPKGIFGAPKIGIANFLVF